MPQYKKKIGKLAKDLEELDKPMKEAGKIALAAIRSYPPYDGGWKEGKEKLLPLCVLVQNMFVKVMRAA